jgi:protein SCO1/2
MLKLILKDCFVALRAPRNDTNQSQTKVGLTDTRSCSQLGLLTQTAGYRRMCSVSLLILCISINICGCYKHENQSSIAVDYGVINPSRDFTLHDQDGNVFHLKDHRGQLVLLFFGYTSCPDVCPTVLGKLARVYGLIGPMRQKVLTLFVTIDPQRDTAQKLKEYLGYFNINAIGLTGSKGEIDAVVDRYKATYTKVETHSSALGYMFDHTDYLYLIDAQGKTSHLFHPDDKSQDMAQIIKGVDLGKN